MELGRSHSRLEPARKSSMVDPRLHMKNNRTEVARALRKEWKKAYDSSGGEPESDIAAFYVNAL